MALLAQANSQNPAE